MSGNYKQEIYPVKETYSSSMSLKTNKLVNVRQLLWKELPVLLGEFLGTFMFLFFAFAFGFSLLVNVAIFSDVSGAMFNPAVTLALWGVGMIRWQRVIHAIIAQLLAGIIAAFLVSVMLPSKLAVATTLNVSTTSVSQGFFLEIFMTAQLLLAILLVPSGPSKPMYCGFALFIAHLTGIYSTGASLNPARTLGPMAVVGAQSSDWIYIVGPVFGAGLAAGIYKVLKMSQQED
ncbi:unnamed protein product [Periconia digitata]|uniref:Aquaporin n=1 Tax=Periconia digitata TaxID=1303443 RepID=A0A9W4UP01_9PLEO|nr:unnamed protein product [Periconia digitata]